MTWLKTGTVTVTNGSATITGSGTLFVDTGTINPGDIFTSADGKLYEILTVNSNTGITLASNYLGSSLSAQAFAIMPIGLLPSTLAQQVKTTLATANTAMASTVRYDISTMGLSLTQQQNARTNIASLSALDVGQGRLSKSGAGGVDVTLTAGEASAQFIELTGTITANINVIVPAAARLFYIYNGTGGAYTVTVKTPSGSGVAVTQGGRTMLECDATNVVNPLSYIKTSGVTEDTSGNLGLGVTPSAWVSTNNKALSVLEANVSFEATNAFSSYTQYAYLSTANNTTGWLLRQTGIAPLQYQQRNGQGHIWRMGTSGTAGTATTWTDQMTLDMSGNLTLVKPASSGLSQLALGTYSAASTSDNALVVQSGNGTTVTTNNLLIRTNGNVTNTNNSYGAISDLKLKENITDTTPKLAGLLQVRIVNYNLKTDPTHKQLGVIAQELERVFPGMVDESPDHEQQTKTREVAVPAVDAVLDADGNVVTEAVAATTRTEDYTEQVDLGTVTKSVKYSVFVPMLIKAIQEQQVLIESLTTRVSSLESATPH